LAVAVDPSGHFAYVANHGSDDVSMYAIDPATGQLRPLPQATVGAGRFPWWVTVDASGRFAYVANHGADTVTGYRLDPATGQLTPNGTLTLPPGSRPAAVVTVTPQALWLRVDETHVRPGAALVLTALITPWPALTRVDWYLVLELPDQTLAFVLGDWTLTEDPRPFQAGWAVEPFSGKLLDLTFRGPEPEGRYQWLAFFTEPGTATLLGAVARAPFLFSPAGQG
jgi:YVTN family beta-propeller protein